MATSSFKGFPAEALDFFAELETNNNREWFQANKERFEGSVRQPMLRLVEAVNAAALECAPDYVTEPQKAVYRIYRDTRFSKDKTPYKTHCGALLIHRALDKNSSAGFYFAMSHKEVEIAAGVYMPDNDWLRLLRDLMDGRHAEFDALTGARQFRNLFGDLQGEQLARMPKGYPADHPAGSLLRRKQMYWYITQDAKLATTPKFLTEITKRLAAAAQVLDFMNAPQLEAKKKESSRKRFMAER